MLMTPQMLYHERARIHQGFEYFCIKVISLSKQSLNIFPQ